MKIGIIIVFNTFEEDNLKKELLKYFKKAKEVEFCLVNNGQSEYVYESLIDISEQRKNVCVVNIRKKKLETAAVRAGARYMYNNFNLKHLGFISEVSGHELLDMIEFLSMYQKEIIIMNTNNQNTRQIKQTFFQSIFSVSKQINQLNLKSAI